jgi:two-component system phosphate regulon sensor histidine kinase PhoR
VLSEERLDEPLAQGVDSMSRQATRMKRIVEDLLTLSRLEMGQSDPESEEDIAVAGLARKLAEDAGRLSGGRGHVIDVDVDDGLILHASAVELGSALSNLVNNAVNHTPPGTAIHVSWKACPGGAVFSVADEGAGIDLEHLPRLTERFYRVDPGRSRASGGTGLGLSIVKHAVMRNGGQLEIDSRPGMGATFSCRFPAERTKRRPPV